jgi:hypothetical protein
MAGELLRWRTAAKMTEFAQALNVRQDGKASTGQCEALSRRPGSGPVADAWTHGFRPARECDDTQRVRARRCCHPKR